MSGLGKSMWLSRPEVNRLNMVLTSSQTLYFQILSNYSLTDFLKIILCKKERVVASCFFFRKHCMNCSIWVLYITTTLLPMILKWMPPNIFSLLFSLSCPGKKDFDLWKPPPNSLDDIPCPFSVHIGGDAFSDELKELHKKEVDEWKEKIVVNDILFHTHRYYNLGWHFWDIILFSFFQKIHWLEGLPSLRPSLRGGCIESFEVGST